jgi:hypothetical protein
LPIFIEMPLNLSLRLGHLLRLEAEVHGEFNAGFNPEPLDPQNRWTHQVSIADATKHRAGSNQTGKEVSGATVTFQMSRAPRRFEEPSSAPATFG